MTVQHVMVLSPAMGNRLCVVHSCEGQLDNGQVHPAPVKMPSTHTSAVAVLMACVLFHENGKKNKREDECLASHRIASQCTSRPKQRDSFWILDIAVLPLSGCCTRLKRHAVRFVRTMRAVLVSNPFWSSRVAYMHKEKKNVGCETNVRMDFLDCCRKDVLHGTNAHKYSRDLSSMGKRTYDLVLRMSEF
mmetsp:Transcript_22498/g.51869  ORF Transcript_22498/g.51869 Transcript_22498/m.51869 type:complete len:190 (-) Transcript_22498:34-603(-)